MNWYEYGARWYDPSIGRFIGVDPISDKFPNLSTYNYASNNPITNIDLHGLQGVSVDLLMKAGMALGNLLGGNNNNSKNPVNNLIIGPQSKRNEALGYMHTASNAAMEFKSNTDKALDNLQTVSQDVQVGCDLIEGGALAATALSGGTLAPIADPVAGIAEAVGTVALGVEVLSDYAKDGKVDQTSDDLLIKMTVGTTGKLVDKGVDMLKIGGSNAISTIEAVKATGNGVVNTGEAAANSQSEKKKEEE